MSQSPEMAKLSARATSSANTMRGYVGHFLWGLAATVALYGLMRSSGRTAASLPWLLSVFFMYGLAVHIPMGRSASGVRSWRAPLLGFVLFGTLAHLSALGLDALLPNGTAGDHRLWLYGLLGMLALVFLMRHGRAFRVARLVGVELMKVRRGPLLRIGLLVVVAATYLAGLTYTPFEGASGWATATHCLGAGHWAADIMALVLGATMLAGEMGLGTMKMILPHAYERCEWIAAKGIVVVLYAFLLVIAVAGTSALYAYGAEGLGDVTKVEPAGFGEEEDTISVFQTADVMRSHFTDTVTASVMSTIATGLIALCFSSLFGGVVPALCASFLALVALRVGNVLLGFSRSIADNLYPLVPDELRRLTGQLGRGFSERWDEHLLGHGIALAVFVGALAWVSASRLFSHRDLRG